MMGHIRLGTLQRTRQWFQVLDLIGAGADTPEVAAATLAASQRGLVSAAKDSDKPAHRLQKMWGEFVRQIEKENSLKKLFTDDHKDRDRQKLYGIRLRPDEKQILLTSLPALFPKPAS
ncbi:MAG: hypothetical protein EXR27_22985 [Betaproteobacteria bacterium]|nr:hypothetical protein [Betaproteobacteria bacterium]